MIKLDSLHKNLKKKKEQISTKRGMCTSLGVAGCLAPPSLHLPYLGNISRSVATSFALVLDFFFGWGGGVIGRGRDLP